jgi:hypothetical protein
MAPEGEASDDAPVPDEELVMRVLMRLGQR